MPNTKIPIGRFIEFLVEGMGLRFRAPLDAFSAVILRTNRGLELVFGALPPWLLIALVTGVACWLLRTRKAAWILGGLLLIWDLGLWGTSVQTMALVITAATFSLALAIPIGILVAESRWLSAIVSPILDFLQTMPRFVYLVPAVVLFGIGAVPGVLSTVTLAVPPTARLTTLGIRQADREVIEAGEAFGCTRWQLLLKIKLPLALPSILMGINQCVLLSLSMVVIASLIGAGGLGDNIVQAIARLSAGDAVEAGLAVVTIALILDQFGQGTAGCLSLRFLGVSSEGSR